MSIAVHRKILTLLFGDVVMSASSAHHAVCAPVSEWYVSCFMLPSPSVSCWVLLSHAFRAYSSSPSIQSPSSTDISSHSILFLQLFPIFCSQIFLHLHNAASLTRLSKAVWPLCPCQLKLKIVHAPLFTSSLITVPSGVFPMCGFFSSSTTMFPARTTFFALK